MILLKLFLTFFEIGLVSFGGGYAMIPLVTEKCITNGWLSEEAIMNYIAVSESTPGPIAINMATFVGSSQGGILGSAMATLGVVMPSFIIILIITAVLKSFIDNKGVQGVLSGIRPVAIGLILSTAATMFLNVLLHITSFKGGVRIEPIGIAIFAFVAVAAYLWKRKFKKPISPILLIIMSAVIGMVVY